MAEDFFCHKQSVTWAPWAASALAPRGQNLLVALPRHSLSPTVQKSEEGACSCNVSLYVSFLSTTVTESHRSSV